MEITNCKLQIITRRSDPVFIGTNCKNWFLAAFSLLLLPTAILAQQKNLPLSNVWDLQIQKEIDQLTIKDTTKKDLLSIHSTVKPYIETGTLNLEHYKRSNCEAHPAYKYGKGPLWYRKIKTEDLFIVKDTTDKFYLTLDPLFDLQRGDDKKDPLGEKNFNNTRGILIQGDVGKKFSFESTFYENQSAFVAYIDSFSQQTGIIPGQGRWKPFKIDKADKHNVSYDYAMASGYISYSPNKHFNIQLGHGKHFIGDGYRSLLLSDNSFNYPFVRITSTFGKFQYTNLYTVFMNFSTGAIPVGTERLFQKKVGNFQFLSWNAHKRLQLGLFQAAISKGTDYRNKFDIAPSFFDPIIFGNAVQYGLHNSYNVILGATIKFKIANTASVYGQVMVDDISTNGPRSVNSKHGFQIGAKYFDAFKVKDLYLQAEFNIIRPYSYSSDSINESYTHYNQALAHPLGANFDELIGRINYQYEGFFTELLINYAFMGADSIGKFYGQNIFLNSTNAAVASKTNFYFQNQGLQKTRIYTDFKIGYMINPATNMNIVIGITDRQFLYNSSNYRSHLLYIGFRTSLSNHYFDF